MSTGLYLTVTCVFILLAVGLILPFVLNDFRGESVNYVTDDFIEESSSQVTLSSLASSLFGILFWNFNISVWINVIIWIIKLLLAIGITVMVLHG